jgi:hypothetical protein
LRNQAFKKTIQTNQIPAGLSLAMQALWYDGKGDWKKAHDLIDHLNDRQAAHVHAYLHRKEGDIWNADYWYSRAGQKRPGLSLEEEWEQLVELYTS